MSTVPTPAGTGLPPGWRFVHDGYKGGPVTFAELKIMATAGKLLPSDRVLRPGGKQWETAGSLPGLFGGSKSAIQVAAAAVAPAPAPMKNRRNAEEEEDEQEAPANTHLRLILVGVGGLCIFSLAAGLLVLCLSGDGASTEAKSPAAKEPETPRPGVVPPKASDPAPAPPPPPRAELTPRQKEIKAAVTKGAAYLRQRLDEGGKFYAFADQTGGADLGAHALVGLTLLESGASPTDPHVVKVAEMVRRSAPNLYFTYSLAVATLFLDRLHPDPAKESSTGDGQLIKTFALRLIANQTPKAGWDYFCRPLTPLEEQSLLEQLQTGTYQPGFKGLSKALNNRDYYDNSIGQFVTLALWTARKHKVPVALPLAAVEKRYRTTQQPDGSWTYNDANRFLRDTSTCAALIGLAVGRGIRDQDKVVSGGPGFLEDSAVQGGFKHLKTVIRPRQPVSPEEVAKRQQHTAELEEILQLRELTKDPEESKKLLERQIALDDSLKMRGLFFDGDSWGNLYFLWSLERMSVIYDLTKIEGVDWHEWGSDFILKNQMDDGSWRERFPGVPDTCFAMLFLLRANVVKDLTDKLRELMRGTGLQPPVGQPPPKKE